MKLTYFVHSTTVDNEAGLATGWVDCELSVKGRKQAQELGELVTDVFDVIFTSDLKRSIETVALAFGTRFPVKNDWRLREINYGDFSQQPSHKVKNNLNPYILEPFPGGESYQDVENRVAGFLKDLKQNYREKSVAIVAHQAPQLALDVLLRGKTWPQAFQDDWRHTHAWQPGWVYEVPV